MKSDRRRIRTRLAVAATTLIMLCACASPISDSERERLEASRWTQERSSQWYAAQPWLVGVNFIPSTAINQLEMWQAPTWDPTTIDRELGWAANLGMNTVRVYLHDLAWQADPEGFKGRVAHFLALAAAHGIKVSFVIFDDVWNPTPESGRQPEPVPGVHNSGWVQSPANADVNNPGAWGRLEDYVKDMLSTFAHDQRILYWDLYNEPGNEGQGDKSLPLLRKTFTWAREINPGQPLTVGIWYGHATLNSFSLSASDIITFHNYGDLDDLKAEIARLKQLDRPLICTEWMARTKDSRFDTHLPLFKSQKVGAISWGLVAGKTQTIYPWGSRKGSAPPALWFHDILQRDGTPYDEDEVAVIRALTRNNGRFSAAKPDTGDRLRNPM